MKKINWINDKTKIPEEIYKMKFDKGYFKTSGMITDFFKMGFISKDQPINAKFLNKYHFECYIPIYKIIKKNKRLVNLLGKFIFRK